MIPLAEMNTTCSSEESSGSDREWATGREDAVPGFAEVRGVTCILATSEFQACA